MSDLTQFVPQQTETVKRIYEFHKALGDAEPQRGYLGASIIGHECDRYLWFNFRGCVREEIKGRVYRLFETGDLAELRFVKELRAIGCTVHDVDENGEQWEISDLGGHLSGHMDGSILGVPEAPKTWHVGEFKTHNDKSFAKLLKEGVLESKPVHWAQMQTYMGGTGMKRALYLAVNKNTDELYSERVRFDSGAYKQLMARAARIIRTSKVPLRLASRPDDFRCKSCSAHALCWGSDDEAPAVPIPSKTCKSCVHSTAETEREGAMWSCSRFETDLPLTGVGVDCPKHLLLPGFVNFAEPQDADDDWIEYKNADGTLWRQGEGEGNWSTKELISSRGPLDGPKGERRKHVAWACEEYSDCRRAFCARHDGALFLCAVCGQAEAELTDDCPGAPATGTYRCYECGRAAEMTVDRTDCPSHSKNGSFCSDDDACFLCDKHEGPAVHQVGDVPVSLAIDLDDLPLLARYPWDDSERIWDGPTEDLKDALGRLGSPAEVLNAMEPKDSQHDDQVDAVEYQLPGGDFLIVSYKQDEKAAIWKGKA